MDKEIGILLKMQSLYEQMSNAEKKVVSFIISNPDKVIHLSVTGLAESSGVSDATVVRTCRKIGMSGYQNLKVTLAQSLVSPIKSIHNEIDESDSASTLTNKVFDSTIHTLNYTRDVLDFRAIEQAAELISTASRVIVFGVGNSHSVVLDLQHKLLRLGINAVCFTDSHMQVVVAASAGRGDTVVGISHSGSSIDVVEAVRTCKENGAKVIGISSFGHSPLSKLADVNLVTASKETEFRISAISSRIAQIVIIDCLYTLIAIGDRERSLANFLKIEEGMEKKKY